MVEDRFDGSGSVVSCDAATLKSLVLALANQFSCQYWMDARHDQTWSHVAIGIYRPYGEFPKAFQREMTEKGFTETVKPGCIRYWEAVRARDEYGVPL